MTRLFAKIEYALEAILHDHADVGVRNSGVKFESGGITIISIIIDVLHKSSSPAL